MRTAQTIEAQNSGDSVEDEKADEKSYKRGQHPNSRANLIPWKPGQVGNPEGKNGHDMAKEIAQAIFTNNPELIYQSFGSVLQKGNAYAFQVLADRAFGKMKETKVLEGADGGPIQSSIEVRFIEADAK